MSYVTNAPESDKRAELAHEYARRGYRVLEEPKGNRLPSFLRPFHPDLIALSEDDNVVVEVKQKLTREAAEELKLLASVLKQHEKWRLELVLLEVSGDRLDSPSLRIIGLKKIYDHLKSAQSLVDGNQPIPALLMAWSALEAILRRMAVRRDIEQNKQPVPMLLRALYSMGDLYRDEYEYLRTALVFRNHIVHGYAAKGLGPSFVKKLLPVAEELLRRLKEKE